MIGLAEKWETPVWLNGWVFIYELGGCGFESCCSDPIKKPTLIKSYKVT